MRSGVSTEVPPYFCTISAISVPLYSQPRVASKL
jgi:hypothetical protein